MLIGPLETNFCEIAIEIEIFSAKKMHLKISFGKWRPLCLGVNVLAVFLDSPLLPQASRPPLSKVIRSSSTNYTYPILGMALVAGQGLLFTVRTVMFFLCIWNHIIRYLILHLLALYCEMNAVVEKSMKVNFHNMLDRYFQTATLPSNTSFLPASNTVWLLPCIKRENNEGMFSWFIAFRHMKWQFIL